MKIVFLLTGSLLMLSFTSPVKTIYDIQVKGISGENLELGKFKGKKIVFITVSGNEQDSLLRKLSQFSLKYQNDVVFIGIPSFEDGYVETNKQMIKKRFKDLNKMDIEFTEGMYTKKTSVNQSELMKLLTHKEQNQYFNNEVMGTGQKFFVDEIGHLYAVIIPQIPLYSPVFERILGRPKPKRQ